MTAKKDKIVRRGFTVIELLVVVSIMAMMAGLVTVNLAGQRTSRTMKIAQNELVTNLREAQSFTLSGRNSGVSQSVQYYVMRFKIGSPSYALQAMYLDPADKSWKAANVQTINFPSGVILSDIAIDGAPIGSSCALVAFHAPFAEIYLNEGCSNPASFPSGTYTLVDGDDYKNILNFVTNVAGFPTSINKKISLTLKYKQETGNKKTVMVNGVTGMICPTKDGATLTCLTNN